MLPAVSRSSLKASPKNYPILRTTIQNCQTVLGKIGIRRVGLPLVTDRTRPQPVTISTEMSGKVNLTLHICWPVKSDERSIGPRIRRRVCSIITVMLLEATILMVPTHSMNHKAGLRYPLHATTCRHPCHIYKVLLRERRIQILHPAVRWWKGEAKNLLRMEVRATTSTPGRLATTTQIPGCPPI